MANKELAVTQNQNTQVDIFAGLAGLEEFKAGKGEQILGLEVVDRSDIKLPKMKLLQLTSQEVSDGKGKAGQFLNTVTGEVFDQLNCILLVLGKSRVKWRKPFKRGEEPECRSFDGIIRHDAGKKCAGCADQDWDNLPNGEKHPPCNMSYIWLGISADGSKSPFRLTASGKSVTPTKDFINVVTLKKYPTFVYKVTISSEKQQNESGTFFVMNYDIAGIVKPEEAVQFKDLAIGMQDMFMEANKIDSENAVLEDPVEQADVDAANPTGSQNKTEVKKDGALF